MTQRIIVGLAIGIVLSALVPARAQNRDQIQQFDQVIREAERDFLLLTRPEMKPAERVLFDYGATLSFNFFAIDDVNQNTHLLRMTDAKFYGHLNLDGVHEAYGRLRYTYLDFNDGDDFDGRGDRYIYPIADRWWYRFDLGRALETTQGQRPDHGFDASVKVGRQFVSWASGLTLYDDLYAVLGDVEFEGFTLTGLAAQTPRSNFIDFDSSRNSFDRDTDRQFFGGMISYDRIPNHRPYFYALHQTDHGGQGTDIIVIPGGTFPTSFDYDSTYFGFGSNGNVLPDLSYEAEFIYQIGDGLSTSIAPGTPAVPVMQTREDIEAWAAKLEFNYHFRDEHRTQFDFETLLASGDDDRAFDTSNTFGGNRGGTNDEAFNAFGYARTGAAFAAPVSNLIMFRTGVSTYPALQPNGPRNLRLGLDLFVFNKMDSDAPLDERTSDDTYLGFETDIYGAWRVTSDVTLNMRYGIFFPGEAIEADNDPRHFLYTGVTYAF